MPATNQNFGMWAGNFMTLQIEVRLPDGTAPDLTGASAAWKLSDDPGGTALITKSASIVGPTADPPVVQVSIDAADTADLPAGQYWHEAEVTDSLGRLTTVAVGRCSVSPSLFA